jgi:hypothetical protein
MPTIGGYPVPLSQSSLYPHTDQRRLDMKDKIYYLEPAQTPILTVLNAMGKNPCVNTEYKWMEDEYLRIRGGKCKVTKSEQITVTAGTYYIAELQLSRTMERQAFEQSGYIKLSAAASEFLDTDGTNMLSTGQNNLFKVKVTVSGTTYNLYVLPPNFYDEQVAAATAAIDGMADTDLKAAASTSYTNPAEIITKHSKVYVVTTTDCTGWSSSTWFNFETEAPGAQVSGWAEGSGLGGESVKQVRFNSNITQIFKDSFSVTGTAQEVQLYGGETEYTRRAARIGAKHKLNMEQAIIENGGYTGRNSTTRTFRGLGLGHSGAASADGDYPAIYTKNGSFNSDFEWDWDYYTDPQDNLFAWFDMMSAILEDSSTENGMLLISNKFNTILHKIAMQSDYAKLMYGTDETIFGVRFNTWRMPDSDIKVAMHREVLRGPKEDYAMWLDMSQMELRPLGSRDTKIYQDVGSQEIDGRIDYYLTEMGFECRNEGRHAIIKLG